MRNAKIPELVRMLSCGNFIGCFLINEMNPRIKIRNTYVISKHF